MLQNNKTYPLSDIRHSQYKLKNPTNINNKVANI